MKNSIAKSVIPHLISMLVKVIWLTCRVRTIHGHQHAQNLIDFNSVFIPCYWHQHHIYGAWYMRRLAQQGTKIGFLISPSSDGDMSAKLAQSWGFTVIRGSSNRTGARAMRDLYNTIIKDQVSPVNTSDGPTGPLHVFKPGAIMLAQLTGAPILPLSYAASHYWKLKSWDEFIVPKPFSKIAIALDEPVMVDKKITQEQTEALQTRLQNTLQELEQHAERLLKN